MKLSSNNRGFTLVEIVFTTVLIGVLGLIIYSLLNIGTILGAKNTAVNTAHQQARTAMLQMVQDLHSAISLPYLVDASKAVVSGQGPAAGISFQLFSGGPYKVSADRLATDTTVTIKNPVATMTPAPVVGQRLIIPGHEIEANITAVSQVDSKTYTLTLDAALGAAISGTATNVIPCFLTDRCFYVINNQTLEWTGPTTRKAFSVMGADITSPTPFTTPTTPAGALYYRFVAAIDLSTSDLNYNNRGFKSANILLNGQVPMRARLTTYQ